MKNINRLIKKFFDEQTEWAEMNGDSDFKDLFLGTITTQQKYYISQTFVSNIQEMF